MLVGKEQRIFKTTTSNLVSGDNSITDNKLNNFLNLKLEVDDIKTVSGIEYENDLIKKDVFFGQYNSNSPAYAKQNNQEIISTYLINFHDVHADYITNQPNKNSVLNINGAASPWFPKSATDNQYNSKKNADERITYMPSYIDTPIDIAYSKNNSYFLLPLNTKKYTNLIQSDNNLLYNNIGVSAEFKPNYNDMIQHNLSKPYYYSDDNSIPIYDLNFTFIQTINLDNNENVKSFLQKHNLLNFKYKHWEEPFDERALSAEVMFDSKTYRLNGDTADSILLRPLLLILLNNATIFSETHIKNIVQDLIASLDIESCLRFLSPIGQITKLNDDIINNFKFNSILNSDFKTENIHDFIENITTKPDYIDTPEVLPQNILLNYDLNTALNTNNQLPVNTFYNKEYLPSAYYNITFLKNNRSPNYNINCIISADITNNGIIDSYDYEIKPEEYLSQTEEEFNKLNSLLNSRLNYANQIEIKKQLVKSNKKIDRNKAINDLYDIDITHSYEANGGLSLFNNLPIKSVTNNMLTQCCNIDNQLSATDSEYQFNYPQRMNTKVNDYLNTWKHLYVANNKLYNVGELLGIRNYVKCR